MKKNKINAKIYLYNNINDPNVFDLLVKLSNLYKTDYIKIATLIYSKELKYKQIASILNVSENYIKSINKDLILIIMVYKIIKEED